MPGDVVDVGRQRFVHCSRRPPMRDRKGCGALVSGSVWSCAACTSSQTTMRACTSRVKTSKRGPQTRRSRGWPGSRARLEDVGIPLACRSVGGCVCPGGLGHDPEGGCGGMAGMLGRVAQCCTAGRRRCPRWRTTPSSRIDGVSPANLVVGVGGRPLLGARRPASSPLLPACAAQQPQTRERLTSGALSRARAPISDRRPTPIAGKTCARVLGRALVTARSGSGRARTLARGTHAVRAVRGGSAPTL